MIEKENRILNKLIDTTDYALFSPTLIFLLSSQPSHKTQNYVIFGFPTISENH